MDKSTKGSLILWAKIKANWWALWHRQCVYTESTQDSYGIYFSTTLVATCTGSIKNEDLQIKKVFYERTER